MRRAEESGSNLRWYSVSDAAILDAEVDAFLAMMAEEPEKAKFLTEAMRRADAPLLPCGFREWLAATGLSRS